MSELRSSGEEQGEALGQMWAWGGRQEGRKAKGNAEEEAPSFWFWAFHPRTGRVWRLQRSGRHAVETAGDQSGQRLPWRVAGRQQLQFSCHQGGGGAWLECATSQCPFPGVASGEPPALKSSPPEEPRPLHGKRVPLGRLAPMWMSSSLPPVAFCFSRHLRFLDAWSIC